ncbi:nucleotide exchange factor GrpE [Thermoflavimicrobium daqui]|uniref:Nucleotide exchange factor GrpE n=1 Tax=Thermoflavimicrobium daqui TaxID=2137476 RepID=A0A364K2Y3_9BACL|nr:nucleotide exchange factor GrpE [Thermoflavimicrobium daqui]RAL23201.1 nucleotide exchange factor GrpE [Thermoflavimicrobium daqui]
MNPNKERNELSGPLASQDARRMRFRMARDDGRQDRQHQQQQVLSFLSSLQANFSSLVGLIESRLRYDKTKEAAFERLYQEMDELKQDQELNQLRPLYIDLILLIDRMNHIYKENLNSGTASPEITSLLESLSHELIEILYRRGVELIVCPSSVFDPRVQQVMEVIPTANPAEDNQVVEVIRHGFKYKDVLLRPEEVVIKKYKP